MPKERVGCILLSLLGTHLGVTSESYGLFKGADGGREDGKEKEKKRKEGLRIVLRWLSNDVSGFLDRGIRDE